MDEQVEFTPGGDGACLTPARAGAMMAPVHTVRRECPLLPIKRLLLCILAVGLALLLGTSLAAAQVPPLVGRGPYVPELVGIPSEAQVIDVHWSGDRRGEFIEIGVLPPAFRGPAPAPVLGFGLAAAPAPVPIPAPAPGPRPTLGPVPTVLIPAR